MATRKMAKQGTGELAPQGMTLDSLPDNLRYYEAPPPPPEPEKPNSFMRGAADTGLSAARGLVGGIKSISDAAGADNAVSEGLDSTSRFLTDAMSPAKRARMADRAKAISDADASGSTSAQIIERLKTLKDDPLDALAEGVGSIAPTVAATLATGGAGGVALGALQGSGSVKGQIFEDVQRELLARGASPEEARQRATEAQAYKGDNAKQIALGAGLGAVAGKLGVEGAANNLAHGASSAPGTLLKRVGMGAAEEGVPEAAQGGQQRYAANQALTTEGMPTDPMQGVAGEAALSGTVGAALGGGIAVPKPHQRVAGDGPIARAANAGIDAANEAGGVPINPPEPVDPAVQQQQQTKLAQQDAQAQDEAQTKAQDAQSTDIGQRAAALHALLQDPTLNETDAEGKPKEQPEIAQARHYAESAMRDDLSPDVRENFMSMAAYALRKVMPEAFPDRSAPKLANDAPALPQIGFDASQNMVASVDGTVYPQSALDARAQDPSGTMLADAQGAVRPQTNAEAATAANIAAERETLGTSVPRGAAEHDTTPTGTLIADPQGNVQPQTVADRANTAQEAQRKADIGLTPDVERAITTRDIGRADGQPLLNRTAARIIQRKHGGEVVAVDGGFKVRVPVAEDAVITKESNATVTKPQADKASVDSGTGPAEAAATADTGARVAAVETSRVDATDAALSRSGDGAAKPGDSRRTARVREQANAFTRRWKNSPQIEVIDSMKDAPEAVKNVDAGQKQRGATGSPRGFYHAGRVYLVASELHGEIDTLNTLAHEALGHSGFKTLFGDKLHGVLDRVAASKADQIAAKAKQYGLDISKESDRRTAAEEILAELAEQEPSNTFVRQAIAAIRSWLRANIPGFGRMKLGDAEIIRSYIVPAREHVKNGPTAKPAPRADDGAVFSRAKTVDDEGAAPKEKPNPRMPANMTAAQQAALGKIGSFAAKDSIAERAKQYTANWQDKFTQGVFDQFAPLKKLNATAYMQARLSKGTDGAVESVFRFGLPKMTDGALDVQSDGEGFKGVLSKLQGEHDLFMAWVAGHRASQLQAEGRERLFTANDIAALKELDKGTMPNGESRAKVYAKALKDFNRYQNAVLDVASEAGLIDAEARKLWNSEHYIPFFRQMEDDAMAGPGQIGGLTGQRAFKKLKGGTEPLGDLLGNTLSNWSHLLSASMKNLAATGALKSAEEMGVASRVTQAEKGSVRAMFDGKERHFMVDDPLVLDALTMLHNPGWNNPAMKAMRGFKRALTTGVTASPSFKIRSLAKDMIASIATNEMSFNPARNFLDGLKGTSAESKEYQSLIAGGGAIRFGSLNDGGQADHAKRLIRQGIKDADVLDSREKLASFMHRAWEGYKEVGDRMESINRAAVYKKAKDDGKSHLEASYLARDLMDFTAMGKWGSIRFLTEVLPFFNARLQGMNKLYRGAKENPARFAAVAGAVAMASALLHINNQDDPEYQKLSEGVRNSYWWVRFGDHAAYISKPFEVGALGSVVERATELMTSGNDYKAADFVKSLQSILTDQLAMNPIPQALRPALEASMNRDTFRDRPIDSPSQEKLLPGDRYTANTSAGAVAVGKAIDVSPQRIEHMIRGYFGWLGAQALSVSDIAARGVMNMPERPSRTIGDTAIVGDFVKPADAASSKYLSRFYDQQRQIDQTYAALKDARETGDIERAAKLQSGNEMKLRPVYQAAERQMLRLNKQIKATTNDRAMSPDQKAETLKSLNHQRDGLARMTDQQARAMSP